MGIPLSGEIFNGSLNGWFGPTGRGRLLAAFLITTCLLAALLWLFAILLSISLLLICFLGPIIFNLVGLICLIILFLIAFGSLGVRLLIRLTVCFRFVFGGLVIRLLLGITALWFWAFGFRLHRMRDWMRVAAVGARMAEWTSAWGSRQWDVA